ncbi:2-hydroxy-6-oxo-2,4-heptadienoate hydrolase (plasmid) [Sphingobium sp. SCG-1]|uniref:alpha/beta fold hydrolase n=1 Tax=Sphingobium sp. SCG-1 TaxID=2072936 RepID=UPI000CD677C6|nr:alpha/beta hydrolase [Sphingobium sp. SCG-1]AUW60571.1 2-hydroxy-6-oxo-2,4-heptadienoate hydrolase [Sphingobium sp. SCG-1]
MNKLNPEVGKNVVVNGLRTNVHDVGAGSPVVLIHGSGPGVTAWANWRLVIPELAKGRRVIAPDMVGFGYTDRPSSITYNLETWLTHIVGLLDTLEIASADIIGNSFGGALALALAIRHPERVNRLVLMGSVGVPFEITEGLDAVWGYEPSIHNMRRIMDFFAFNEGLVNDDLAELRYRASMQTGVQDAFAAMFPAPRQRWVDALASADEDIRMLKHSTLILHGRDDRVIPLATSLRLNELICDSQLHVFGRCGHWTQIEHANRFTQIVDLFLAEDRRMDYFAIE